MTLISIIITTKNEAKNICNCLDSIKRQTFQQDQIEIIVVDNNSTDETKKLAHKFTEHVYNKGPERSTQRNFGVTQAQGKYILYLDADMILTPDVVAECVGTLNNNDDLVALYVPEIIMGESYWCKVRRFERSFYDGTVIDAVRCIRRDAFVRINGFNENMIAAEDWDFTKRLKGMGEFALIKNPLYHNESNFNIVRYIKKKKFYATDIVRYIEKWGKNDCDVKKQLGLYYRFFAVFVENGKAKKIIRHPLLTLGMYFLKILVGINYLIK